MIGKIVSSLAAADSSSAYARSMARRPVLHVYDDHYHCFGCGAHGSVIDFVMQAEKLSFPQAVERLAAQAGMTLPSANHEEMERERRRGSLYDVLEAAAAYYQKLLRMPEGKPALDYLRLRGVGEAAIDRFRSGIRAGRPSRSRRRSPGKAFPNRQ